MSGSSLSSLSALVCCLVRVNGVAHGLKSLAVTESAGMKKSRRSGALLTDAYARWLGMQMTHAVVSLGLSAVTAAFGDLLATNELCVPLIHRCVGNPLL